MLLVPWFELRGSWVEPLRLRDPAVPSHNFVQCSRLQFFMDFGNLSPILEALRNPYTPPADSMAGPGPKLFYIYIFRSQIMGA